MPAPRSKRKAIIVDQINNDNQENNPPILTLPKWNPQSKIEGKDEPIFTYKRRVDSAHKNQIHMDRIKSYCVATKASISEKVRDGDLHIRIFHIIYKLPYSLSSFV